MEQEQLQNTHSQTIRVMPKCPICGSKQLVGSIITKRIGNSNPVNAFFCRNDNCFREFVINKKGKSELIRDKPKKSGRRSTIKIDKTLLSKLYMEGKSTKNIAEILNINKETARRRIKKMKAEGELL